MARFVEVEPGRFVNPEQVAGFWPLANPVNGTWIALAGGAAATTDRPVGEVRGLLEEPCDVCAERTVVDDVGEG